MEEILFSALNDFISDNFFSAIEKFSEIIKTPNENLIAEALIFRSKSYCEIEEFQKALEDLENILKNFPDNNQINSFDLFFTLGKVYFNLEKFQEASENLKKALTLSTNEEQRQRLVILMNKIEIELNENLNNNNSDTYNDNNNTKTSLKTPFSNSNLNINSSNIKFIHNWYQNASFITIAIDCSLALNSEEYEVAIEKRNIKINKKPEVLEQELGIICLYEINLSNCVIPSESTSQINNKKIEIKLKKEFDNFQWVTLESSKANNAIRSDGTMEGFKPSYPSSSKQKKDWDNIDKEIGRELDKEDSQGSEAMMKLFKQIYERGDEETRRAMVKSFQTSGGTVLSTNWGEVKEKEYDGKDRPTAPDGQEWADKVNKK
jgi:suppressor of G2 allele of SKP1